MLIITGTQRSGTTAAASLFKAEGYDLGSDLWDEVGGLENEIICAFYRDYLGDPVFPFSNFPGLEKQLLREEWYIQDAFVCLNLPVVKFSMLCMNPAFVTIWSKFRPPSKGDRFLIMQRDLWNVVSSKDAHREIFLQDSWLLNQSAATMRANRTMSISYLTALGYPISIMPFKDLMNHFCINDYLAQVGCNLRIKEETWETVIDTDKVHFQ